MIDIQSISPLDLPSMELERCSKLPPVTCVYFAIDSTGSVQYVGQTVNLNRRWIQHHRYGLLSKMKSVRIAYLVTDTDSLLSIETKLIQWFRPPLNKSGVERDLKSIDSAFFSGINSNNEQLTGRSATCSQCKSSNLKRNGTQNSKQRYSCLECGCSFVLDPVMPKGRPLIGSEPLTPAEKQKRYRAKMKAKTQS